MKKWAREEVNRRLATIAQNATDPTARNNASVLLRLRQGDPATLKAHAIAQTLTDAWLAKSRG